MPLGQMESRAGTVVTLVFGSVLSLAINSAASSGTAREDLPLTIIQARTADGAHLGLPSFPGCARAHAVAVWPVRSSQSPNAQLRVAFFSPIARRAAWVWGRRDLRSISLSMRDELRLDSSRDDVNDEAAIRWARSIVAADLRSCLARSRSAVALASRRSASSRISSGVKVTTGKRDRTVLVKGSAATSPRSRPWWFPLWLMDPFIDLVMADYGLSEDEAASMVLTHGKDHRLGFTSHNGFPRGSIIVAHEFTELRDLVQFAWDFGRRCESMVLAPKGPIK